MTSQSQKPLLFSETLALVFVFLGFGKLKILKKKLLKRQSLLSGVWVLVEEFLKSMKYLTIAKHSSFAVVLRTCPVQVQLKDLSLTFLKTTPGKPRFNLYEYQKLGRKN